MGKISSIEEAITTELPLDVMRNRVVERIPIHAFITS